MSASWQEFRRPFNVFSVAIAVIGICIGWYFGVASLEKVSVLYSTNTYQIYDPASVGSIFTVIGRDGKKISTDVYSTTVNVKNTGTVRLDSSRVREPLTISLIPDYARVPNSPLPLSPSNSRGSPLTSADTPIDVKVLSASVLSPGDEILAVKSENGVVTIRWKYFDPDSSFTISIISTGAFGVIAKAALNIDSNPGYIHDQADLETLGERIGDRLSLVIVGVVFCFFAPISLLTNRQYAKRVSRRPLRLLLVSVTSSIVFMGLMLGFVMIMDIKVGRQATSFLDRSRY